MKTLETYHKLIEKHCYFAEQLAKQRKRTVGKHIRYEDLLSAALYGLVDAAFHYEKEKGSFKTYAYTFIKGEMSKYIRELNCLCGAEHRYNSMIASSLDEHTDDELNIIDESYDTDDELFEEVTKVLPEIGRKIMYWYCYENLTLKQIGERLGVGESRASQMLKTQKDVLRQKWTGCEDELYTKAVR